MLITKSVMVKWVSSNKNYYIEKGYLYTKHYDQFEVKVEDLPKGSHSMVDVLCDYCLETIVTKEYRTYVKQNEESIINKDCCKKCQSAKTIESNLLVYGKENVFQIEEVREKYKQNMIANHGVENPSQMEDYNEKFTQTSMKNYGTPHPFQSQSVKDKIVDTMISRYGVKSYTQTKEYIEKTIKTNNLKYGADWANQSEDIRAKYKETCMNTYGVDNYAKSDEFNQKYKEVMLKNYGVEHYSKTDAFKEKFETTSLERFGTTHPWKNIDVLKKREQTNIERFGYKVANQNPDIRAKAVQTLYKNGNVPTSTEQLKVFEILRDNGFDVILNYPFKNFNFDVAIFKDGIKIDLEYDCWYWHKNRLHFDRCRDELSKQDGWKILRVKSSRKIPTIDELNAAIDKLTDTDRVFTQIVFDDWGDKEVSS